MDNHRFPHAVAPNNDGDIAGPHYACRCGQPAPTDKEHLMADSKLSAEFDKISDKAKAGSDALRAANERTREQLADDVDNARDRAAAAADHAKDKADEARDTASSHWQDLRNTWHAHVDEVRSRINKHKDKIDAQGAATDADLTEAYAYDAIDFALDAIEEAQYAVLDAMYARANAVALRS